MRKLRRVVVGEGMVVGFLTGESWESGTWVLFRCFF